MTEFILKAEGLVKSYQIKNQQITPVLKGLSISILEGEFLAITGPSGAGKSTLLHLLGKLDSADLGNIQLNIGTAIYDYKKLSSIEESKMRNKHIGFIFQFHHLLVEFTILENTMLPALIAGISFAEAKIKALELLDLVGISHRVEHKPSEISGGEQQRVAIARALINSPQIVFADEPTGNLDMVNAQAVMKLIQELRARYNLTFVVATHSNDVATLAERVLKIQDGRMLD
jgi:lipoprotein-releasing system ATP-binding protein